MKPLKRELETDDHPLEEGSWAISYGDMITLLLGFFILFFTLEPPKKAEEKLIDALIKNLSEGGTLLIEHKGDKGGMKVEQDLPDPAPQPLKDLTEKKQLKRKRWELARDEISRVYAKILTFFIRTGDLPEVVEKNNEPEIPTQKTSAATFVINPEQTMERYGDQLIIDFPGISFFDTAQTELTQKGKSALDAFIETYRPYAGKSIVNIVGYADKRPVKQHSRFRDNLELSVLRSVSVQRYLQELGVPMGRTRLAGHGVFSGSLSILPKTEVEALALARRIILVIEPED